jgi:hypothetical protein
MLLTYAPQILPSFCEILFHGISLRLLQWFSFVQANEARTAFACCFSIKDAQSKLHSVDTEAGYRHGTPLPNAQLSRNMQGKPADSTRMTSTHDHLSDVGRKNSAASAPSFCVQLAFCMHSLDSKLRRCFLAAG